jgi:hypothetical protein
VGYGSYRGDEIKPFLPWSRPACELYAAATNSAGREMRLEKRGMLRAEAERHNIIRKDEMSNKVTKQGGMQ